MISPDSDNTHQEYCRTLLKLWRDRAHKGARAHYRAAELKAQGNQILTIINAVSAILVLFFTNATWIEKIFFNGDKYHLLYVGTSSLFGMIVVITTILQYILKYEDLSHQHKAAGAEFSNIQRKIERYLSNSYYSMPMVHNINREYNHITKSYPLVRAKIWHAPEFDGLARAIQKAEAKLGYADTDITRDP